MPKQLKEIEVSHISLVKAGANGKKIIYKSKETEPTYQKDFKILKTDKKRGIIYGIVYSPDEVDSQDEFAKSEDIEIAAYNFMKQKRVSNIDKDHTFEKEDAYVCESWIVRKDDPLFKKEKEGSWAVGIKLESAELKKAVEDGDIEGLSMAGVAKRVEVKKEDTKISLDDIAEALKKIFGSVRFDIHGGWYKPMEKQEIKKQKGDDLDKEELEKTLASVVSVALEPLNKKVEELTEVIDTQKEELEKANEEIKKHNELFSKSKQLFTFEKKQNSDDSIVA